jgi:tetratricopeptide (TPR) repeat protein
MWNTRVIGLRALALLLCIALAAVLPSVAQEHSQPFLVQGKVVEPSGGPVPGAAVFLDSNNGDTANAITNRTGNFELEVTGGKKHVLRVLAQGFRAEVIELPAYNAGNIQLTVSLKIAPTGSPEVHDSAIQFSDSPNFTVAGVTDWSNVGLHGSDVNVKTSETLTKEAAALKPAAKTSGVTNKDAEAHRLLGDEREQSGDPVAAEREYETAVKLDPSEENYFAWGAELLLHRAGLAAVEVLTRGAAAHPNSQRMVEALGAAFYANGQFAESAQQMCRAADLLPSIAEPYLFLGRIQQAASDIFPCSEQKLQRFANEQSRSARANFYYGLVLMKKAKQSQYDADFQQAEAAFRNALAVDPSFGEVYLQLGMVYNARGKKEAALQEFEKAVRATPRLTAAHYQLSLAYRRSGESGKADQEMKKYEELHRAEEAALEKERKEMKQFVTILQQSSPK